MLRRVLLVLSRALSKGARILEVAASRRGGPPYAAWFAADGDHTYRLEYPLGPDSVVMAVGGYKGSWSSDIFGSFGCVVHIYEPVAEFITILRKRFGRNPRITVHPVGLSNRTADVRITVENDRSSLTTGRGQELVRVVDAKDAVEELGQVDLMMINIEGAEYDVIERMCSSGSIGRVRYLQIQFHDFVPNASTRRRHCQDLLRASHDLSWEFPFVWESWTRRVVS